MERYKIILAYDGTRFVGVQRQGQARTVQFELETALRRLNWQGRAVMLSGRTDSGVHAEGQVVAFDLEWLHTPEELGRALNANLPEDVAVRVVERAAPTFHPRYDAKWRCYNYHILFAPTRDPLHERYAWRVWPACPVETLQAAAQLLLGTHDFSAFGSSPRPGGSTVREVFEAGWQDLGQSRLRFEVIANAFLYHMVRRMVLVQVLVGQQRLSLGALKRAVEEGHPVQQGLAPPQGLVLKQVQY